MIVIYHANCNDGFTAAWCAHKVYGDSATYVPAYYGTEPPDVAGQDVLIVDFSYPRTMLEKMAGVAKSIRVIDHHKTAQADLAGLPYALFDMDRSGAGLAWDELVGGERPLLIDYVEDRDLWRFKLPHAKELSALLMLEKQSFERWDHLAHAFGSRHSGPTDALLEAGQTAVMAIAAYVDHVRKNARWVNFDGYIVPWVNAPQMHVSDLLDALARDVTPFAVAWWQRADGVFQYSLRSRGEFDVSAVAKERGGGGHKSAAGFQSAVMLCPSTVPSQPATESHGSA